MSPLECSFPQLRGSSATPRRRGTQTIMPLRRCVVAIRKQRSGMCGSDGGDLIAAGIRSLEEMPLEAASLLRGDRLAWERVQMEIQILRQLLDSAKSIAQSPLIRALQFCNG
ncbi:hypothetical protein TNIN_118931 [Trichonephila inaurata madagascariensis]|uniref:Uncharacterized protein n=1 Tax=Trichonephila inaurata madagascariensis TaxID=2747483 RepID=A0A8X6YVN9_9ARAC|nr:hypothetical protein TNIN_118931 [Trichonephila inaurata madagascariensis]